MKETADIVEGYTYLNYNYRTGSGARDFEMDSCTEFSINIEATFLYPEGNPQELELDLGKLTAIRVHVADALDAGLSLFDLFDVRQEIHEASADLFDDTYSDFAPQILEEFEDTWFCEDILLISELTVKPFARGQGVGVSALYRFILDHMQGCSFVMLKPFPLQMDYAHKDPERRRSLALDRFTQDKAEATRKLGKLYGTLGFLKLDGMSHMLRPAFSEVEPPAPGMLRNSITLPPQVLEEHLS